MTVYKGADAAEVAAVFRRTKELPEGMSVVEGAVPFAFESSPKGASRGYYVISPAALWRWWSGGKEAAEHDN